MVASFEVHLCAEPLGAEICGIDLTRAVETETFAKINQTFAQRGVIFFATKILHLANNWLFPDGLENWSVSRWPSIP